MKTRRRAPCKRASNSDAAIRRRRAPVGVSIRRVGPYSPISSAILSGSTIAEHLPDTIPPDRQPGMAETGLRRERKDSAPLGGEEKRRVPRIDLDRYAVGEAQQRGPVDRDVAEQPWLGLGLVGVEIEIAVDLGRGQEQAEAVGGVEALDRGPPERVVHRHQGRRPEPPAPRLPHGAAIRPCRLVLPRGGCLPSRIARPLFAQWWPVDNG